MAPVIPDDKAIKPGIIDEMAQAINEGHCGLCERRKSTCFYCFDDAARAGKVVARRLREALLDGDDVYPSPVAALLAELEGNGGG